MNLDNMVVAADTTNIQAGGKSFFEKMYDGLTAGAAGATVSAIASIYNTGAWYANKIFDAGVEEMDTARTLRDLDTNWAQYYEQNKEVLDTVGFIGGSFIPGGAAIKGLRLAQKVGQPAGAVSRVLGFAANRQQAAVEAGLKELASAGPSAFSLLNKNRIASLAWGTADNVLQAATFEVATLAAMHQSTTLKDESAGNILWDMTKNALIGGIFGGAIDGLFTNAIFKRAGKTVDKKLRSYDSVTAYQDLGLTFGDETFGAIKAALDIPKYMPTMAGVLPYSYKLNGRDFSTTLDIGDLAGHASKDTFDIALKNMAGKLAYLHKDDTSIGTALANSLLKIVYEGRSLNKADGEISNRLGEILFNLKQVGPLEETNQNLLVDVFHFDKTAKITDAGGLASAFKTSSSEGTVPYILKGSLNDAKIAVIGPKFAKITDAFKAGNDVAIDAEGVTHINPASAIFKKASAKDPGITKAIYHVRSAQMVDEALSTIADEATKASPLRLAEDVVVAGNKSFKQSVKSFTPSENVDAITARHFWAASRNSIPEDVPIMWNDFSLLDRAIELGVGKMQIRLEDGTIKEFAGTGQLKNFVLEQKIRLAQGTEDSWTKMYDPRVLAYQLNVEADWLEAAMHANWDFVKLSQLKESFRPLNSYAARDHLLLGYDTALMKQAADFPEAITAWQSRVTRAKQNTDNASATVLGEAFSRFPDAPEDLKIDSTGTGATFFGSSNANYDDPGRLLFQHVGQGTNLTQQERRTRKLGAIQGPAAKVITDKNAELGAILTAVRRSDQALYLDPENKRIIDLATQKKLAKGEQVEPAVNIPITVPSTLDFLQEFKLGHDEWFQQKQVLATARGTALKWDPQALYLPPVNTRRLPFFAFVREADGKIMSSGEVSVLTGRSAAELQQKINQVKQAMPDVQIITKAEINRYHRAMGDFDYQSQMNAPEFDSFLKKNGIYGDFAPTLEPAAVVQDFVDFIARREDALVQAAVSTKYAQQFAELKFLSDNYTSVAKSKLQYLGKQAGKTVDDPFGDYIRLALNQSKRAEYTFWHDANSFVDALGTRAYDAVEKASIEARKNSISWEEANRRMEQVGLKGVFSSQADYLSQQTGGGGNLIKNAVYKGNMLLTTLGLRLDFANSLINIISSPLLMGAEISSIKSSLKKNPELLSQIEGLTSVAVPGQPGLAVPSAMRLMTRAVHNYFSADKTKLLARYQDIGAIKTISSQLHVMREELALTPKLVPSVWAERVNYWTDKASGWTGNNFAEEFTRFMAADVMKQITDPIVLAGKMGEKEQNAFINIFVNRVQGNYVTSQRPIAFQGTLGGALSLFQTYQFNLLQQLFRHIENRDARTIAVMAGLQTSIFGLNGLPLFDAINTHLVGNASINDQHHDAYSSAVRLFGKEAGDWLMYGSASALPIFSDKSPALYTRGDLNPRHITVLPNPMNPMEIPVVSGMARIAGAIAQTGKQIMAGGDMSAALLHGMEHQGISRPLAGMAQVLGGQSTTSRGSIISANLDWFSIASATRALGAKPMDESVALNHVFRMNAYKAKDRERVEQLGIVIKQKLRDGTFTEEDATDFMSSYAAAGGRIEGYAKAIQRWFKSATQSDVNRMMNAQNSVYGRRLLEVMGADPLPDYANPGE